MVSKTRMEGLVKACDWQEVDAAIRGNPNLLAVRDQRGRNWLHICCGLDVAKRSIDASETIRTAEVLLKAGLDINQEAFREGEWKATPLWYSVAFGRNLALMEYLLDNGSDPNHCLWAAAYNDDPAAIRLLIEHGADYKCSADDATPFLFAVQWSHFAAAEELLKLGSDVDYVDPKQMTALHCMLKKGSDKSHFRMVMKYGPSGDIPDSRGMTAAEIMMRKRDPEFHEMARTLMARD